MTKLILRIKQSTFWDWNGFAYSKRFFEASFSSQWIPSFQLGSSISIHEHNGGPFHFHWFIELTVFCIEFRIGADISKEIWEEE